MFVVANGWMDQDGTEVGLAHRNYNVYGLRPGHIVLTGDPVPFPKRGSSPIFGQISIVAKRLDGSRCHFVER